MASSSSSSSIHLPDDAAASHDKPADHSNSSNDVELAVQRDSDDPFTIPPSQPSMPSSEPEPNHDDPHRPHQGRYVPSHPNYRLSREELRELAETTLLKLDQGLYILPGSNEPFDLTPKILHTNEHTTYYSPDDKDISNWSKADLGNNGNGKVKARHTQIAIREYSTLVCARRLHQWLDMHSEYQNRTIGVLNFASAKKPGGGFINGSQAQEESIARASTLYPSLVDPKAAPFYKHYVLNPNDSFYTHAMIYSPSVVLFRNDLGHWMNPIEVDVLTSAAVNAGEIRESVRWEEEVRQLNERMKVAQAEADKLVDLDDLDDEAFEKAVLAAQGQEEETISSENRSKTPEKAEDDEEEETTPKAIRKVESSPLSAEGSTESNPTNESSEPTTVAESDPNPSSTEEDPLDPFYLAEIQIDAEMYERIARLLYLFHKRGAKHLILGSFGTGVFQNRISLVAGIFYDLLVGPDAKFKDVFDTVVFAILGGYTVRVFRETFKDKALDQLEGEDEIVDEVGSEWEGTLSGGIAPEEAIEDGRD